MQHAYNVTVAGSIPARRTKVIDAVGPAPTAVATHCSHRSESKGGDEPGCGGMRRCSMKLA